MTSAAESAQSGSQMASALAQGVDALSRQQQIVFRRYQRKVLPLDGFVFWVATQQVLAANGSLHYISQRQQAEDDSATINSVIFTSERELDDLNEETPGFIYIAEIDDMRFTFGQRVGYYQQAGLHHYRGTAVLAPLQTQIIDGAWQIDETAAIVSDSLPIWIGLTEIAPVFPSFAVPANLPPPYITAHIDPGTTRALEPIPVLDINSSSSQLMAETVRFTLYGLNNNQAIDFVNYVLAAGQDDTAPFGLMGMAALRDEKRTQAELGILAQKKTLALEISYRQTRIQQIARQLILKAAMAVTID